MSAYQNIQRQYSRILIRRISVVMMVLVGLCAFGVQSAAAAKPRPVHAKTITRKHHAARHNSQHGHSLVLKRRGTRTAPVFKRTSGRLTGTPTTTVTPTAAPAVTTSPAVSTPSTLSTTPATSVGAPIPAAPNTAATGPTGDPGSWNTIFDDEFTGNTLDTTKWNPNWYGSSNTLPSNAAGSDDQSCANPANTTEANNELTLAVTAGTCTTDTGKTYPYSGSLINTWNKFSFTYGFLETKMYVPTNAAGQLINSVSFWADGTGTWPSTGELDVMELLQGCGPNGSAGYAYHFHSPSGGPGACAPQSFDTGGWHTFGADWEPGKVTYYYDGQNIGSITSGITASPMNLILSQAVDTTYTSTIVQPAQAQIKYVRVWQHN